MLYKTVEADFWIFAFKDFYREKSNMPLNKRSRLGNLLSKSSMWVRENNRRSNLSTRRPDASIEKVINIRILSDVFSILMEHCNILDSVQIRVLCVAIYMLLRLLNIPFRQCRQLLADLSYKISQILNFIVNLIR